MRTWPVSSPRAVAGGKIENENNNTLKTKGYHLEHNFGHGKKHLSSLLAAMNILALLTHTFLSYCDNAYRLIRATLPNAQDLLRRCPRSAALHVLPILGDPDGLHDARLEIGPYLSAVPAQAGTPKEA